MNKETCHLPVFQVLFQTGVLTLRTAKTRPDSLEGQTNSPGMAIGYCKALGLVPSQDLPQRVEEETDHLLGLTGREHQIERPGDLGEARHCD